MGDLIFQAIFILLNIILVLSLLGIIGGILFEIFSLVRLFIKLKKSKNQSPKVYVYYFLMILCLLIMDVSWVLNFGFIRLIFSFLTLPIIHAIIFIILNGKILCKYFDSAKLKLYTVLSFITYSLSYVFLPDSEEIQSMVFFGLLHGEDVYYISGILCVITLTIHITITIFQLLEMNAIKKQNNLNSN